MRELIVSFESLKDEVLSHDHDVGFAGETTDIVNHALNMLGSRLVKLEPSIDISLLYDIFNLFGKLLFKMI